MRYKEGDWVRITRAANDAWLGRTYRVVGVSGERGGWLELDGERPDGYDTPFFWLTENLTLLPRPLDKAAVRRAVVERDATTFDEKVRALYTDAGDVLLSKHHDYGPHNIGRSPGGPLNGLRVRMWDKLARLNNLVDKGEEAKHESLEDTLLDLANYALIGVLVLRGDWPSE